MFGKRAWNGLLIKIFTIGIFLFCCDPLSALEPRDFKFRHLSSKEGLSDDKVRAIIKDSHGFMWFGTWGGLNRYDGYQFRVYKKQRNNPNSLSNDIITAIHEDEDGKFWLGTIGGLNRFDPATEMFKRYVHNPQDSRSLSHDILVSITEDQNGILWIGTWGGGLIRFDPTTEHFSSYVHDSQNASSISGDYVTAVHQARDGSYWVMTRSNGLNLFDPSTQTFKHFSLQEKNEGSPWGQNIFHEDHSGTLWFTSRKALYAINPKTNKSSHYFPKSSDEFNVKGVIGGTRGDLWVYGQGNKYSLYRFDKETKQLIPYKTKEKLNVMYGDDAGLIWIGTMRFGTMLFDQSPPKFSHVSYDPAGQKGPPDKQILSLSEDDSGNFWLGTTKNAIHWNRKTGEFTPYQGNPRIPSSIRKSSQCWKVLADRKGKIWFASDDYGIHRLDPVTGILKNYRHIPANPISLTSDYTIAIISDKNDTIWVGTDKGLNRFNPDHDGFDRFYIDPSKPENPRNNIITIMEDSKGFLWTGSWYGGLSCFDKTAGRFIKSYRHAPNDSNSIISNHVNVVHERRDGRFWIGTSNGLSLFDPETETFKHYTEKNGLPNNYIKGILEDDKQQLWISTEKGLSLFNLERGIFRNYDVSDGFHSNQFTRGSYAKGSSGEFFFGGMNGFSYFYPERVKDNPFVPPVHITDFQLFNKSVPINPDSILTKAISRTDRIVLSHAQNIFSMEFASLSYRFPAKNRYRYMLTGLDKNWNEVGSKRRYVTYTNLDPGEYVFRVQGSNNDGVWNEEGASLGVKILPPWWQTWWFRFLSSSILLLIGFGVYRIRITSLKNQKILLENLVDQRTEELASSNEQLRIAKNAAEEATSAKSEFLANMSHEIRTPMNAVIGMAHLALKTELTSKQQDYLNKIRSSAHSLLGIINDILDFSKIEAGKLDMEAVEFDLSETLDNVANVVTVKAQEKRNLEVLFYLDSKIPNSLVGDPLRLNQILVNLGNNAVKFTQRGEIVLTAKVDSRSDDKITLQFSMRDTGIGMTEQEQAQLFQAFSQADTSTTRKYGGTGLGLTICKRLVNMMGGDIWVESAPGKGTTFSFTASFGLGKESGIKRFVPSRDLRDLKVLVVDDSATSRGILRDILESFSFEIALAPSGEEALEEIERADREKPFELVLMDWKMPGMDGLETSRRIKTYKGLNKIPAIIIVTAYGREEIMRQADEIGLEGFLHKPVSASMLFDTVMQVLGKEVEHPSGTRSEKDKQTKEITAIAGARVLLVEDNEINQQVALEILEGAGFSVTVANDGRQGVEAVKEEQYDAVLMDIQMPVMDGYTASREIRNLKTEIRNVPIIAMTAHAMAGDEQKSIDAGMNDHITKPIDPDQLFSTLQKWIKPTSESASAKITPVLIAPPESDQTVSDRIELPESLAGFDLAAGLTRLMGNQRLYLKLLLDFGANYGSAADDIRDALAGGDIEQAHSLVHNLKGLSGNLEANDLHAVVLEMESLIKGQTAETISGKHLKSKLEELENALKQALNAINNLGLAPGLKHTGNLEDATKSVPPELVDKVAGQIKSATEMGDVVQIKSIAEDLMSASDDAALFCDKLIQLAEDFDFNGIRKLLSEFDSSDPDG